jgi:hypothetical protein
MAVPKPKRGYKILLRLKGRWDTGKPVKRVTLSPRGGREGDLQPYPLCTTFLLLLQYLEFFLGMKMNIDRYMLAVL